MINNTINNFVNTFENKFYNYLYLPTISPNRISFSTYFQLDNWPNNSLSDWDLNCYLNINKCSPKIITDIDYFIRNFNGLSDVGLFSRPTLETEDKLQYMAYTPNQSFAPFLDLHINGQINNSLWSTVYNSGEEEHKSWSILTGWRKIRKNDINGAKNVYKGHIERYYPNEEKKFTNYPKDYFIEKFPEKKDSNVAVFLNNK